MFAFIKGKLHAASPLFAIIEANGIGYHLHIPASHYSQLPSLQEDVLLYTSFVTRETSQTLYGFLGAQERDLFEVLLGISGIGPKTALALISSFTSADLSEAIRNKAVSTICKVPGIGKKTAERLIIEVHDKLPLLAQRELEQLSSEENVMTRDAMSALINLGYTRAAANTALHKALSALPEETNLSAVITEALKYV